MNGTALSFRAAAGRLHCRRRDGQIRRRSRGRISHRYGAVFFDMVDDRFREAQFAGGRFILRLVALFPHVKSDNPPPVLQNDRVRARRGHGDEKQRDRKQNAPRSIDLPHLSILIF